MKTTLILFKKYLGLCIVLFVTCLICGCNSNNTSAGNNDSADNNDVTKDSSKNAVKSTATALAYTMISMPSFQISGSDFKALLITAATKVDSLEADISVDGSGNATVQFYRWKTGIKTLIPGNFTPHSTYSYPVFNTDSPLRCLDGLHGVTFSPNTNTTYYLVPDVTAFPGGATLYPFYHIKTTDTYQASSITTKQLNPIPPGQISIALY